jgi:hypothetical protein
MADCYYHGYSGGPGPCPQCASEDARGSERGALGPTLEGDVARELANINSIGRKAAAEQLRRQHDLKDERKKSS